ncbi:hypothetical protein PV10_07219 [Exophiala mesophila]|uniref:Uncharacterized protein n=1 Tax=Exophiala mesophila TaxID=212818 RepID=A0A0D1XP13_EXOME|nr:uncharacterized protein PV10_07219 [Exophiala mesophila]KIV89851.1 hypothetical protein PV10_07219 [Exophiala mesophila]
MSQLSAKTLSLACFLISLVSRADDDDFSIVENHILIEKTVAALKGRLGLELVEVGNSYSGHVARGEVLHGMIEDVIKGRYPNHHVITLLQERGFDVEAEMYAEIEGLQEFL